MNMPRISVVIPLYNKANQVLDTLHSVAAQTHPASEIIVVDDGSTDDGAQLVAKSKLPQVKIVFRKHQGGAMARNIGLSKARYDYVAFIEPGDQWRPMFLEEMASLINKYPHAGLYASRYQSMKAGGRYLDAKIALPDLDPSGTILDNYFEVASKGDMPFLLSSSLVKRSAFPVIGGFRNGDTLGEAQDFFARVALRTTIAYSPNILAFNYMDDARILNNLVPSEECPFSRRLNILVENGKVRRGLAHDIKRYCGAHLCEIALLNAKTGRCDVARKILKDPRCKLRPARFVKAWFVANVFKFPTRRAGLAASI